MKKIMTAVLAVSLIVSMAGCSGNKAKNENTTTQATATVQPQKTSYQAAYAEKTVGNIKLEVPSDWEYKQNGASEHSFQADDTNYCKIKIIDTASAITDDFKNQFFKDFENLKDFAQSSGVNANGIAYVTANGTNADQSTVGAYLLTDGKRMYTLEMHESKDSAYDYESTFRHMIDSVKIIDMQAPVSTSSSTSTATNGKGKMTLEIYNKIKNGMTYDEVAALIGEEPAQETQAEAMGAAVKVCSWYGTSGNGANAAIEFQNGKVASKTQIGLQ